MQLNLGGPCEDGQSLQVWGRLKGQSEVAVGVFSGGLVCVQDLKVQCDWGNP